MEVHLVISNSLNCIIRSNERDGYYDYKYDFNVCILSTCGINQMFTLRLYSINILHIDQWSGAYKVEFNGKNLPRLDTEIINHESFCIGIVLE